MRHSALFVLALGLLILACAGCPGSLNNWSSPVVDTAPTPSATDDAGTPTSPSCPDVGTVTLPQSCALGGCHDAKTKAQGLDLASPGLASRLVGVMGTEGQGLLIDPVTPNDSVMYTKLLASPPFGARMPTATALDAATIQCVLTWITTEAASGPSPSMTDAGASPISDGAATADQAAPADGSSADVGVTGFTTIRVAAGQTAAVTDAQGNVWSADESFAGGTPHVPATVTAITGTDTPALYNAERYGSPSFTYQFSVPNGAYGVTLKFAEIYVTGPGLRQFDIGINGATVETNFDIYAAAGGMNAAVDKTFTVQVTNGAIQLAFTPGTVQNPKVDAIEIVQGSADGG